MATKCCDSIRDLHGVAVDAGQVFISLRGSSHEKKIIHGLIFSLCFSTRGLVRHP